MSFPTARSLVASLVYLLAFSCGAATAQNAPPHSPGQLVDADKRVEKAAAMLDGCDENSGMALLMMQDVLRKDPDNVGAYVQLARAVMKTNWSAAGLLQAEHLLDTALKLSPRDQGALILQGYVYTHQNRPGDAEHLFKAANTGEVKNLWLWTNWGDLLMLQGRPDEAMAMYRKSVKGVAVASCDRARTQAYDKLIMLLERKGDSDELLHLYENRFHEYNHEGACYQTDYFRYLISVRGDVERALSELPESRDYDCEGKQTREVLGMAQYASWAAKPAGADWELTIARMNLPVSAHTIFVLSGSAHTVIAVERLKKMGTDIDQEDDEGNTALALALIERNYKAAESLVRVGANTQRPTGELHIPVALLPVLEGDVRGMRLMRKLGADYSRLRFQGATAIEIAESAGDDNMVKALGRSGARL